MRRSEVRIDPLSVSLECSFSPQEPEFDAQSRQAIDQHWTKRLGENPRLVRGSVLWLQSALTRPDRVSLSFGITDYAHYLHTIDVATPLNIPCRVAYTCGLLVTSDGFGVFGEMAAHTSTPRRLQCAGGGLALADTVKNTVNLFGSISAELNEELNLDTTMPAVRRSLQRPTFIKSGGDFDFVALIYLVPVALALTEVRERYLEIPVEEREFVEIVGVELVPGKVAEFLAQDYRPRVDYLDALLRRIAAERLSQSPIA